MKNILLLIFAILLLGCNDKPDNDTIKLENKLIKINVDNEDLQLHIYVIDSCEYIGHLSDYAPACYLVHKGNCTYCKFRNKK